eukprot:Rmarinus@m.8510
MAFNSAYCCAPSCWYLFQGILIVISIHFARADHELIGCLAETFRFGASAIDVGVISSSGCQSLYSRRVSQYCCDIVAELVSDRCIGMGMDFSQSSVEKDAYVSFLHMTVSRCRFEAGVGYDLYGCADGVVTGEEQCDDGNAISGDGC